MLLSGVAEELRVMKRRASIPLRLRKLAIYNMSVKGLLLYMLSKRTSFSSTPRVVVTSLMRVLVDERKPFAFVTFAASSSLTSVSFCSADSVMYSSLERLTRSCNIFLPPLFMPTSTLSARFPANWQVARYLPLHYFLSLP